MSATLLLGMTTTDLVFKTTLPALGLAILVGTYVPPAADSLFSLTM